MIRRLNPYSRTNQLIVDGVIFAAALTAAYLIRFEGSPPWVSSKQLMIWLPYLVAARLAVNWKLGIYRFIWRYVSLSDALTISRSLMVVTVVLVCLRLFYPSWGLFSAQLRLPLSVIALEFLLSLTGTLGARALRRILYDRGQRVALSALQSVKRVILYGAGRAGVLLLKDLKNHPEMEVVGFVDDDQQKVGTVISGVKVLGGGDALPELVRRLSVDDIVICLAAGGRKVLTPVLAKCEPTGISPKIIPPLREIVEGMVKISHFREVRVEDLLGRDSFELAEVDAEVRKAYADKRILVTGAGGSIGSELARQLLALGPNSLIVLDKDENSVYEFDQELSFRFPKARVNSVIADLRVRERIFSLFAELKPEVVFHAAAHKHVPLMEKNPCEAVLNNVMGTETLLEACREHGTERFVFVSTDKAVNPSSVMGATKRVGELLVQAYANGGRLPSACVRFGNVMDSRGSVIPLFRKQISEGGPITVTHPDVVRFFMTIPEAVQLIMCAGTLGSHGEVFVLDMGDPRKIIDMALEMARLSGLEPGKDIEITFTGLRPGEKLVEELVGADESICPTRFEKLSMIVPQTWDGNKLRQSVSELVGAAQQNKRADICRILDGMNLGFHSDANGKD